MNKKIIFLCITTLLIIFVSLVYAQGGGGAPAPVPANGSGEGGGGLAEGKGLISGEVTPAEAGIKVRVIQNLSRVAETITNEEGNYKIFGLNPGIYGLLFIKNGLVYIYNDKINPLLELTVNETILVTANQDSSDYNINLNTESKDYIMDRIWIKFKSDASIEEMISTVTFYNCTTIHPQHITAGEKWYVLDIPDSKTALRMIQLFKQNPNVKSAHLTLTTYTVEPPIKDDITEEISEEVAEENISKKVSGEAMFSFKWLWAIVIIVVIVIVYFIKNKRRK